MATLLIPVPKRPYKVTRKPPSASRRVCLTRRQGLVWSSFHCRLSLLASIHPSMDLGGGSSPHCFPSHKVARVRIPSLLAAALIGRLFFSLFPPSPVSFSGWRDADDGIASVPSALANEPLHVFPSNRHMFRSPETASLDRRRSAAARGH